MVRSGLITPSSLEQARARVDEVGGTIGEQLVTAGVIVDQTGGMTAKYGKALKPYRSGAATLRFPPDRPLPLGLITKLAKQRVLERRAAKH